MKTEQQLIIEKLEIAVNKGKTTLRQASEKMNVSRVSLFYYRRNVVKMPHEQYIKLENYLKELNK